MKQAARFMLGQMNNNRLSVTLADAPEKKHPGHKIRVVEQRNVSWYRALCADHPGNRKRYKRGDTLIRRSCVINALTRFIQYEKYSSVYIDRLKPYMKSVREQLNSKNPEIVME